MPPTALFEDVRRFIHGHRRFLLLTHVVPDGDGLLAAIALARHLRARGREATVAAEGRRVPDFARPFDPEGEVTTLDRLAEDPAWAGRFDAVLVLDTSKASRLGPFHRDLAASGLPVAVVDHHLVEEEGNLEGPRAIDEEAAAVGEMLVGYLEEEGDPFTDRVMVQALLATLSHDTGHFRYNNTTRKTLETASRLVDRGGSLPEAYALFWESSTPAAFRLQGHLMSRLHVECGGRLAWFTMSQRDLQQFGVLREQTEEFVSVPRCLDSVQVVAFFSELEPELAPDRTRVSLRSKGPVTVHEVARRFGGGGHAFAAGARTPDSLEDTAAAVTRALAERIRRELGPDPSPEAR